MRACVALVSMPMGICISRRRARGIEIAGRVASGWNEPAEPKKRVRRHRGNGGRAGQVEAGRQGPRIKKAREGLGGGKKYINKQFPRKDPPKS